LRVHANVLTCILKLMLQRQQQLLLSPLLLDAEAQASQRGLLLPLEVRGEAAGGRA
jgi:hypothetical protein